MQPAKDDTKTPDAKPVSPEQEAVRKLTKELRQVEAKRRLFRRTVIQYERVKKRFTGTIDKMMSTEDQNEASQKEMAIAVYRLLRNFCISFNTFDMVDRNEDKQVFPAKFEAEIKAILGEPSFVDKVQKALKASKPEEALDELPVSVDNKVVKSALDFLEKYEKKEVVSKLEAELETLTKQIDGMRDDLKNQRAEITKKEPVREPKNAKSKDEKKKAKKESTPASTEDRFRNLIKEVRDRVEGIKLSKDDYKTYSDVQGEIDSFLSEATHDILAIKQSLKDRFQAVQKGNKGGQSNNKDRRSRSRKPRDRGGKGDPQEKKEEGQQSVFSKAQQM